MKHTASAKAKMSEFHKARYKADPEIAKRHSARMKKMWRDPKYRAREMRKKRSPEFRAKISATSRGRKWKKEFRERMLAGLQKRWDDPKYVEKMKAHGRRLWRNPEYRAKMVESAKRMWKDPAFREKMKHADQSFRRTPEYKEKMSKATRKIWRNPEMRAKVSEAFKRNANGFMRESTLEGSVVNWWRRQGRITMKMHANFFVGAPDRIFLLPKGKCAFVEFKKPDGRGGLSKIQKHIHGLFRAVGHEVHVLHSGDDAKKLLGSLWKARR